MPGESALQFGHDNAVLKGRAANVFNPEADLKTGNIVAVVMSHDDAKIHGRRFDIAQVKSIAPGPCGAKVFTIQYYEPLRPGRANLNVGCLAFIGQESTQLMGRWKPARHQATTTSTEILCHAWVWPSGAKKGLIPDKDRDAISAELDRMTEM